MGLDMYLAVDAEAPFEALCEEVERVGLLRRYSWKEPGESEYGDVEAITDAAGNYPGLPEVAYWRKANMIHGWFVREIGQGVDECQLMRVKRSHLEDLVARCERVLAAPDRAGAAAEEGLEPMQGFFFGSYEYGKWYDDDLRDTVEQLRKVLDAPWSDGIGFVYRASW